jgi:hypothetical protein
LETKGRRELPILKESDTSFGYTERTYHLRQRQNGSLVEFAWIYSDTGKLLSPIFHCAEHAQIWAEKRSGNTHIEVTRMRLE